MAQGSAICGLGDVGGLQCSARQGILFRNIRVAACIGGQLLSRHRLAHRRRISSYRRFWREPEAVVMSPLLRE